jgi:uncharacterized protein (DUF736 family)
MSYQPKEGSGTLFKNDRKTTENHPDFTGSIMINGKEHWFSAWTKEGKKGKFLSVSVGKEKEESKPAKLYESVKSDPFIDDSCPF